MFPGGPMPDDMKDLTRLLKSFQDQDGNIDPDKAPPDMKVHPSHCILPSADVANDLRICCGTLIDKLVCRTSSKGCRMCSGLRARRVHRRRQ